MEHQVVLRKKDFNAFIESLAREKKVIAPTAKGSESFAFGQVTSGKEVSLKYVSTILPPKKYFMPQREKLIEYNKTKKEWKAVLEYDELVIFGVHTCDLAGIQCLNMVFSDEPKDINYLARKKHITIIGFECNDYCDEYASCKVVDSHLPNGGYDLFFTELKDSYIVHVNTLVGEELIKIAKLFKPVKTIHIAQFKDVRSKKKDIFKDEVNANYKDLKPLFDRSFQAKTWKDLDKRCLACGNCTNVCPTCYCFDIEDEINLDLNTGFGYRVWDSCQNEEFAKVAGGENFRRERSARQRHRYMRKFKYPVDRYSRYFCTGCGRCSRTCMAKINLKETINFLIEEAK